MPENKIKILFFIDSFRIGGMYRQVFYLVKYLNREKFEPVLCTSSTKGGLSEEYEKIGCRLVNLGWKNRIEPVIIERLVKVLDTENPDIIFITIAQNLLYYRIARLFCHNRALQVGSFRGLSFWKGHINKFYQPIDNFFSKWLYATSDCIVVNSIMVKKHYSRIVKVNPKKPIEVIYNGSDFNFPVSRSEFEIRQELNIKPDETVIIMVARLDPFKDFVTLLDAVKIVIKTDIKAKFLLLGDGDIRNLLEQTIIQMDLKENVLLIGEKKDVFNYVNIATLSVLSTNGEGFSNSILESMAVGKPMIATDVGGNVEVIGNNSKYGLLVPPKSPKMLAEAILKLMGNAEMRKEMGQAAKERIHQLCDIEKYISSYEELFLRSLNKKNRFYS